MKGIVPLFLGIFGTFALSWAGLILIPNYQIGHLDPQVDEEGNDPYPAPTSGMADRGRQIYAANGCVYCHSQQMRSDYVASDLERTRDPGPTPKPKWGERRSAPRDYLFERPIMLGKMRLGPDLANIGKSAPVEKDDAAPAASPAASGSASPASPVSNSAPGASPAVSAAKENAPAAASATPPGSARPPTTPASSPAPGGSPAPSAAKVAAVTSPAQAPATPAAATKGAPPPYSAAWHHRHLYSPRSLILDSNMPAYHFLYEKRRISGERASDAVQLSEKEAVPEGWEVVPTYDARCLVAYLMSLDQSHALQEVRALATAPAPASSSASPAPAPAKEAK
jgi:cbb3-type cytochrome oxidase cytochrome c subunit